MPDLLSSPDTHMRVVLADFNNKTRGEDPTIHFYEHFRSAYDKQLKIQRGVFTPRSPSSPPSSAASTSFCQPSSAWRTPSPPPSLGGNDRPFAG